MRSSTFVIGILLGLAVGWMLVNLFLPSLLDGIIKEIGVRGIGKAIVPPHLDEQKLREKAQEAEGRITK